MNIAFLVPIIILIGMIVLIWALWEMEANRRRKLVKQIILICMTQILAYIIICMYFGG